MGANAVTTVPVYVAGEVLTAADMNITNSGINVFATTVERDAAFGGTGEKILAEGQFAYLEDSNTTQYYDGATWQPVGVTPGLVFIKAQTIGTAVNSVTVTDAFSSTYDNYLITASGGVASTDSAALNITLGSTATGYYRFLVYGSYGSNTVNGLASANATAWSDTGYGTTNTISLNVNLFNPNLAKRTLLANNFAAAATGGLAGFNSGYLNDSTQYTAFTIGAGSGVTMTGGTIRVYGYRNS